MSWMDAKLKEISDLMGRYHLTDQEFARGVELMRRTMLEVASYTWKAAAFEADKCASRLSRESSPGHYNKYDLMGLAADFYANAEGYRMPDLEHVDFTRNTPCSAEDTDNRIRALGEKYRAKEP